MAPSQLKRLKASLRDQGVVGPQKSKKQKTQAFIAASTEKRVVRSVALEGIREQFNPFEVKKLARGGKFNSITSNGQSKAMIIGRPGVTKGVGEEVRRQTLLTEMRRRRKTGGILDRRFGEDDPTMTPEERALERFVKEKQRGGKKGSLFDLEDDENGTEELTHLGQSLSLVKGMQQDDFNETDLLQLDDEDVNLEGEQRGMKRRRLSTSHEIEDVSDQESQAEHGKPKTKQEVMREVMAKSKLYKYERQKAREDDDGLRAKLDEGLADLYELLRETRHHGNAKVPTSGSAHTNINADRAALINGKGRALADREYDERLRQMAFDARSKPTSRTKTEEEKAAEDAERLKNLEEKRVRRMNGEDEDGNESLASEIHGDEDFEDVTQEARLLGNGIPTQPQRRDLDIEDEDDFFLEDNLIASDSEIDLQSVNDDNLDKSQTTVEEGDQDDEDDEENEFVGGLITKDDIGRSDLRDQQSNWTKVHGTSEGEELAFTYPCPQSHEELLSITGNATLSDLPTIIQRIRALYHPKLATENKDKLGAFAKILVQHTSYLANQTIRPPFVILEALIRHLHSLAKSFPIEIGEAFRDHMKTIQNDRPMALIAGDLVVLTAIGTIFPTSDHFHQVVTPAMLSIARYIGQKIPQSIADLAKGIYLCTLCVQFQGLSKRYIPELANYFLNTLAMLSPEKPKAPFGTYPNHGSSDSLRIGYLSSAAIEGRRLDFWDIEHEEGETNDEVKTALLNTTIQLVGLISNLWQEKAAYCEIFEPFLEASNHLISKPCASRLSPSSMKHLIATHTTLTDCLRTAILNRTPLHLHNHRPLAIKTAIPKFEESFHPDRHYDADRDRTELAKLRAEHKRERKGALRELRKDASFVARESLREKKERDAEYEKKYRRLVAEVQGEEGREANAYERERRARKSKGRAVK